MKNSSKFLWLEYIAVSIIVIAFFVISYCGFFTDDDIDMCCGVSTISDVFEHTKSWYFTLGGRLFSVASQYLFSGMLVNNRIWFDTVNTLFFVLLIMTCGRLINDGKKENVFSVLLFALLFWFLCPVPRQTLFWAAGSTTYLWANALTFVFLLFFQKYKDDNFGVIGKLGLFFVSIFAATEFITSASICGAFVVYYAFHIKSFKRNAVPFVIGFVLGSMVLLFAPGNFVRVLGFSKPSILEQFLMAKYKTMWVFLVVLVWGWIRNKDVVKTWVKNNSILLLSLGWSVIAFNVVFRPYNRALFFTETLSLVLFLKFLFDNYDIIRIRFIDKFLIHNLSVIKSVVIILLFVVFMVDSGFAIVETKKNRDTNNLIMNEIVDSGGIIVLNRWTPSHRMAYVEYYTPGIWEPLADRFGLDSVYVYPYYCQDCYYKQGNVYSDEVSLDELTIFNIGTGKPVRIIVRIENEYLQEPNDQVIFTIDYTRPRKWYRLWLDKWRNYQYDRTLVVKRDKPDFCFEGYCYYVFWFSRGSDLKSVKYEFK